MPAARNRMFLVGGAVGVLAVAGAILIVRSGDEPPARPDSPSQPSASVPNLPEPGQVPVVRHKPPPASDTPDAPGAMRFVRGGRTQLGVDQQSDDELIAWCKTQHGSDCSTATFARDLPLRDTILKGFYLDRTEVTNRDFAAFLERRHAALQGDRVLVDGKPVARLLPGSGLETAAGHVRARADADEKPVAGVTFAGAQTYCLDQGRRLPTSGEWEHGARGPYRARFPWGTTDPDCDHAVYARGAGQACAKLGPGPLKVASVDGDISISGVYDLAGNVAEWTLDLYPGKDVKRGPVPWREVRGGAFDLPVEHLRAARRLAVREDDARIDVGFRCAKSTD